MGTKSCRDVGGYSVKESFGGSLMQSFPKKCLELSLHFLVQSTLKKVILRKSIISIEKDMCGKN